MGDKCKKQSKVGGFREGLKNVHLGGCWDNSLVNILLIDLSIFVYLFDSGGWREGGRVTHFMLVLYDVRLG